MIIACSGASHSGKSTFAEILKKLHPEIMMQHELILSSGNKYDEERKQAIDELRANPYEYFKWEKNIIGKKMEQEYEANLIKNHADIIFERSLADSFYYLTRFVDISSFNSEQLNDYNRFLEKLLQLANVHYSAVYDFILIFSPVTFDELCDERRSKNLKNDHYREYQTIKIINQGMLQPALHHKIMNIHMMSKRLEELDGYVDFIYTTLKDMLKTQNRNNQ